MLAITLALQFVYVATQIPNAPVNYNEVAEHLSLFSTAFR